MILTTLGFVFFNLQGKVEMGLCLFPCCGRFLETGACRLVANHLSPSPQRPRLGEFVVVVHDCEPPTAGGL